MSKLSTIEEWVREGYDVLFQLYEERDGMDIGYRYTIDKGGFSTIESSLFISGSVPSAKIAAEYVVLRTSMESSVNTDRGI